MKPLHALLIAAALFACKKDDDTPAPTPTPSTPQPIYLLAPELISPADGSTQPRANITFRWWGVEGAAAYGIVRQRQHNTQLVWQNEDSDTVTDTTIVYGVPEGLIYNARWRVRTKASDGTYGAWSNWYYYSYP